MQCAKKCSKSLQCQQLIRVFTCEKADGKHEAAKGKSSDLRCERAKCLIFKGRTDQRNAQINFSLINLLLFKLLRHVTATQLEPSSGSLKSLQVTSHCNLLGYYDAVVYCIHVAMCLLWNAQHSTVSTSPHEYRYTSAF